MKSYFDKMWEIEEEIFCKTSQNKVRTKEDVNHWLIRGMQLMDGMFEPRSNKFGKYLELRNDTVNSVSKCIERQKNYVACINDVSGEIDFEKVRSCVYTGSVNNDGGNERTMEEGVETRRVLRGVRFGVRARLVFRLPSG